MKYCQGIFDWQQIKQSVILLGWPAGWEDLWQDHPHLWAVQSAHPCLWPYGEILGNVDVSAEFYLYILWIKWSDKERVKKKDCFEKIDIHKIHHMPDIHIFGAG